jgi:hypothetical protein
MAFGLPDKPVGLSDFSPFRRATNGLPAESPGVAFLARDRLLLAASILR